MAFKSLFGGLFDDAGGGKADPTGKAVDAAGSAAAGNVSGVDSAGYVTGAVETAAESANPYTAERVISRQGRKNAEKSGHPERYSGFANVYSRNFRAAAGDTAVDADDRTSPVALDGSNAPQMADPKLWWLLSGTQSPYIDAMADRELQEDGQPGFWNMYSGLHNLALKITGGIYGVRGV